MPFSSGRVRDLPRCLPMPPAKRLSNPSTTPTPRDRRRGFAWGFVGVASFSLTLPATRVAVAGLDPVFVGLGRAVVAAVPQRERDGRVEANCRGLPLSPAA